MATLTVKVHNRRGDAIEGARLIFFDKTTGKVKLAQSKLGGDYAVEVDPNKTYSAIPIERGYIPESTDIAVPKGGGAVAPIILKEEPGPGSIPVSSLPVFGSSLDQTFLQSVSDPATSLEAKISIPEANEAVGLFSVVNLLLAGMIQDNEKVDVLGVDKLYFGLQNSEDPERKRLNVSDSVIADVIHRVGRLHDTLDRSQTDLNFILQEARRQFNLGTNNLVSGNAQFPTFF